MSIESAKKFRKKMNTDPEFGRKVMSFEGVEGFLEFIVKEGFDFTGEELREVNEEIYKGVDGELGLDELELVAGGVSTMLPPCTPQSTMPYCKIQFMGKSCN
ncbi:MAG: Nif11-like leader peptide family natural product precursor [Eubacteriales bacterium]|nr:Nif11-like leader peptide family natural product precursor [Eubacteriales bacterium]MDD3199758.1 Nif11-like leader peptide family natural product precursor [Eubacteriales bacterium]